MHECHCLGALHELMRKGKSIIGCVVIVHTSITTSSQATSRHLSEWYRL